MLRVNFRSAKKYVLHSLFFPNLQYAEANIFIVEFSISWYNIKDLIRDS